jgi:hypothetical protein
MPVTPELHDDARRRGLDTAECAAWRAFAARVRVLAAED